MNECSYTWKEWDRERKELIRIECSEGTWSGSEEYCIFHDPSPIKDALLLMWQVKEKLAEKDYNFRGYYFPKSIDFKGTEFEEYTTFEEATFQEGANFRDATFHKAVHFDDATFQGSVSFQDATFQKNTYFNGANFQGNAYFKRATFQNTYFDDATFQNTYFDDATFQKTSFYEATFQKFAQFDGATFQEDANFRNSTFHKAVYSRGATFQDVYFGGATFQEFVDFSRATFRNADFKRVTFQGAIFSRATFVAAYFSRATFEKVSFEEATFQEYVNLWEATFQRVYFSELERIYRTLKHKNQRDGDYSQAGNFYYQEMEMKRKGTELSIGHLWLEFYRRLAGYGEKPELVIRNSFLVILLGAVLFFFCGVARVGTELPPEENPYIIDYSLNSLNSSYTTFIDFGYCMYYSVVTFTTLGYGDIHPLGFSHIIASVEALIGVFFMALFVVVFARKMMR